MEGFFSEYFCFEKEVNKVIVNRYLEFDCEVYFKEC